MSCFRFQSWVCGACKQLALSKVGSVAHASGLWVWNGELLLVMTTRIAPCWMGLGSLKWGGAAVPVERVEYTMWPVDGACGLGQIAWGVAFGDDAIMDESGTWECLLVTACCRPGCRHSESLRVLDFASLHVPSSAGSRTR